MIGHTFQKVFLPNNPEKLCDRTDLLWFLPTWLFFVEFMMNSNQLYGNKLFEVLFDLVVAPCSTLRLLLFFECAATKQFLYQQVLSVFPKPFTPTSLERDSYWIKAQHVNTIHSGPWATLIIIINYAHWSWHQGSLRLLISWVWVPKFELSNNCIIHQTWIT